MRRHASAAPSPQRWVATNSTAWLTARLSAVFVGVAVGLAAPTQAEAACADPVPLLDALDTAVVEARFDGVRDLITQVEGALGCAPALADRAHLGRLYRAQGAWLALSGAPEESALAWRSAWAVDPDGWTPAFGDALRAGRDAAVRAAPAAGTGTILVTPAPTEFRTAVDGIEVSLPASTAPGFHLVQVLGPDGGPAQFARQILIIAPGEEVRVNTGPLTLIVAVAEPAASPPLATAPAAVPASAGREHTRWPLWTGLGLGALAGGTAALARMQRDDIEEATTVSDLESAYGTQKGWAFATYGLGGLAVVGVSAGFVL
jgi:hypothetical protein